MEPKAKVTIWLRYEGVVEGRNVYGVSVAGQLRVTGVPYDTAHTFFWGACEALRAVGLLGITGEDGD